MSIEDRADYALLNWSRQGALSRLAERSADGPDAVDWSADSAGRLRYLSGEFGGRTRAAPADIARSFLADNAELFGLKADLADLGEPQVDGGGRERVTAMRFPQVVEGARVYASGFRVEVTRLGVVTTVCGRTVETENVPTVPAVDASTAVRLAREHLCVPSDIELTAEQVLTDVTVNMMGPDQPLVRPAWLVSIDGPDARVDVLVESDAGITTVATPVDGTDVEDCPTELPLYHLNPVTGVPDFVTFGPAGARTSGSASGDPARAALAFFSDHPLMFGTGDVPNQLRVVRVEKDPGPPLMTHVVLQQVYGGVEVLGAELRVHLDPGLNVSSINGIYMRDPRVVPVTGLVQSEARDTAVEAVRQFRTQNNLAGDPAADVQDEGLVLFPGELTGAPYTHNAMAWQFQFPEMTMLIDARSTEFRGGVLWAYPNRLGAERVIYDALGLGEISFPVEVMRNGTPVGATPPNAEVAPADAFMQPVLAFYAGLGRASWDGRDSAAEFVTNSVFTLTTGAAAHWDIVRQQAWFQPGTMGAWIAGHEFTHGVTMSTAFLMPIDEPGALNEHYSDVLGGCIVRSFSSIRQIPATYGAYVQRSPSCAAPEAVFSGMCDSGNVHTNCAIGNRAAVLLANGNAPTGTHTGIGINRLARLFFDTLTTRMHPWSRYIDERLNTWETARALAARGTLVVDDADPTKTLDFTGVAAEVSWAFQSVGVVPSLIGGWFTVPGSITGQHSGATQTWWPNQTMPACELVGDIELVVSVRDPIAGTLPWWEGRSRVNGPGGGSVTFPGGVFGASIVGHSVGTANKQTTVDFFHSGFLPFEFAPNILPIPDPACPPPPPNGPPPKSEFVTWGPTHWHDFFGGGKGVDRLNLGSSVLDPANQACTIDLVELELLDRNGQILGRTQLGSPPAVHRYGPFGSLSFGVELVAAMLNTADPGIDVNWWFDVGSAVRYRVHYYCTGDRCDLRA
jgi:Zn-dependent metalloprotease